MPLQPAPENPWGITQYGYWSDMSHNPPLRDQLAAQGVAYEELPIPHLVGMAGAAALVGYISPASDQPVTVLAIPKRPDVDAFGEDYYYLQGVPLSDAVARGEHYWVDEVYPAVNDWP
jgi:hypothetical protein